ncbi:MAG: IS66 family transposase, partial [Solirubrobacterales bacterium]|nr:IS66 family transposase [Solirubrobacterales bacterium]
MPDRRPSYEELEALVASQATLIEELRTEVAELRGRLDQNSRNSSKPPSSDGYEKPAPKSLRRPSGRKPGGQPGHPGRHLKQVERPDEVIRHVPDRCGACGGDLQGAEVVAEEARQVFDLPPVALHVTEHRAQRRRCACGALSAAPFPQGLSAPAQYGPALRALALYLICFQHLPYQRAARLLADWLGAPISTGTLRAIVERGGGDLDEFEGIVRKRLIGSAVAHFDETGARADGALRWVHSASTERLTLYGVHDRRGEDGIDHLGVLGRFGGVAVHDGWATYRNYEDATHALCNVHHLRELLGAIERDPETQTWAQEMDALLREVKAGVERARAAGQSALSPAALKAFEKRYEQVISLGHEQNPPPTKRTGKRGPIGRSKTANLHRRLDEHREEVLRFAHDFRVPFDNYADVLVMPMLAWRGGCCRGVRLRE